MSTVSQPQKRRVRESNHTETQNGDRQIGNIGVRRHDIQTQTGILSVALDDDLIALHRHCREGTRQQSETPNHTDFRSAQQ